MNTRIFSIIAATCFTAGVSGQKLESIGDFFGSGQENAELMFKSYFSPWTNALGASLNGGWYNTAKPHKPGGFDLTVTINTAFVPDMHKTFDMAELNLNNVTYSDEYGSIAPTIAGKRDGGIPIIYTPSESYPNQTVTINSPNGVGLGFMPAPMAQIGIGIIKGTDLTFRYVPELSFRNYGSIGLWGVGIKHSIKQWIPVLSKMPVFQLSAQAGYTNFSSSANVQVTPEAYGITNYTGEYNNQNIELQVKSFTASVLVGADLKVICVYGGLGFATTNANLKLNGLYPVPTVNTSGQLDVADIENPVDVKMANSDGSKTKPRLNAGLRLKMGFFTIHADYVYANYSSVTTGIGITFR